MNKNSNTKKIPIQEETDRHKGKRKKKKEFIPKWKVGDKVVVKKSRGSNALYLIEVVCITELGNWEKVIYYGKILKVSQEKILKHISR